MTTKNVNVKSFHEHIQAGSVAPPEPSPPPRVACRESKYSSDNKGGFSPRCLRSKPVAANRKFSGYMGCISLVPKHRIRLFSMSALLYGPAGTLAVLPEHHHIAS